jgi:hypothetical protein
MIQDYTISGGGFGNGATQLQSPNPGPVGYQAPNPQGSHRYMQLLFEQPDGFVVPASVQGMVQGRQNFDIREFMQQSNLVRTLSCRICRVLRLNLHHSRSQDGEITSLSKMVLLVTLVVGLVQALQPSLPRLP